MPPGGETSPSSTIRNICRLFAQTGRLPVSSPRNSQVKRQPATAALVTPEPYRGFAKVLALFYPDA